MEYLSVQLLSQRNAEFCKIMYSILHSFLSLTNQPSISLQPAFYRIDISLLSPSNQPYNFIPKILFDFESDFDRCLAEGDPRKNVTQISLIPQIY